MLAPPTFFYDLNKSRLQLLNGWNVVCKDTHFAGLGGYVDLNTDLTLGSALSHAQGKGIELSVDAHIRRFVDGLDHEF